MSRLPAVHDGTLSIAPGVTCAHVETPDWFAWLQEASSFTFAGPAGTFTARHEDRAGSRFWYAYRRKAGKLRKTYLGRSPELTLQRLEQAARTLASSDGAAPNGLQDGRLPPLIATKIATPQPGMSLVARPAVVARCLESIERPCTIIAAPAGFGKTTLLIVACERLRERRWQVAWVSLEETEQDPVRFWSYALAALDGAQPGISSVARRMLATPRPLPIERVLTVLINALAGATTPIALVLDDYYRAAVPAIDQGLTFLVEHAPAALHLVVATRADPALPLARLRAQGRIAELHAADLRFSTDEAGRFMRETMHVSLPAEQLAWLDERTEGWVAGLQLAALSLRDQTNMPDLVADLSATPRYIAEYLIDEVLEHQPEDVQLFLLQTAPLERLTGPLCDAVTGRTDSAAMLAQLMRAQLFVTPLDAARTWYRYHPLFAEVLCERLQRTGLDALEQCHRRAAEWLRQEGMIGEAIRHLIAARAFIEAAPLIEGETDRLVLRGEIAGLVAEVRALPRDVILMHPHLSTLFAAGLLLQGEAPEATAWVDTLEQQLAEHGARPGEISGEIAVIRALLLLFVGDVAGGAALAREAVMQLSPGNQLLRGLALWLTHIGGVLGEEDLSEAAQTMADIAEESLRAANLLVASLALITKADIEVYQGRLHRAVQTSREVLRLVPQAGGQYHPIAAMVYCLLGEVQREWNDLDSAEGELRHALALGNVESMVEGHISLALVQTARERFDEALVTLEEIPVHQLSPWDVTQCEVGRARVLIAQGQLAEVARWAEACQRDRREPTASATTGLFRDMEDLALARVALAQGCAGEAVAPLEDLCAQATRAGRWRNALEARMLLARARWMLGEVDPALRDLEASLALAAPEGFVRVFLDEGEPMADLLASYVASRPSSRERAHALTLLAAFGRAVAPSALAQSITLSPRELDVLRLLVTGRSNEAIASELVVALSTVKWHIAHIYRKLGVTGRVRALARARELRLIA
jgi:LuxR family transcriptional regulator, maltose regulon positive regulatory protein